MAGSVALDTDALDAAIVLMDAFAERTGLTGRRPPVRYLWTDAFAACNFRYLAGQGAGDRFNALAGTTIDQVHDHLGHFRSDDVRSGWLQGPHGRADADHPTRCGLRIGKPLPERDAGEPVDERLEWDRDGQYFHYLARWMQALDQLSFANRDPRLHRWACELADVAHRAFTWHGPEGPRMYWKMSTDLSRPLVASMGQHDALDGLVAALVLASPGQALPDAASPDLRPAMRDFAAMVDPDALATTDLLGLGGLLMDGLRLDRLVRAGSGHLEPLRDRVLDSALVGLRHCRVAPDAPADARLGFRELGLAIGLAAVAHIAGDKPGWRARHDAFARHLRLRDEINRFWLDPARRRAAAWTGHQDINDVMLATSLAPDGWLEPLSAPAR